MMKLVGVNSNFINQKKRSCSIKEIILLTHTYICCKRLLDQN